MVKVYIERNLNLGGWGNRSASTRARASALHWALIAATLVVMLPLILLFLSALLVAVVVFAAVGLVMRVVAVVRNLLPGTSPKDLSRSDTDGRVNVRVIRR